jgi:hypothetical protein
MEYASVVPAVLGIHWLPLWAVVVTVICVIIVVIVVCLLWKALGSMIDPFQYPGPTRHTNE